MTRSAPPSPQFLAAVSSMASRSPYRGGGRKQWGRGFSGSPRSGERGQHFVSGDSHFRSVQDANLGFRQGGDRVINQRPPPRYQGQQFRQPLRYNQNQQFRQPPPFVPNQNQTQNQHFQQHPPLNQNQAFRPRLPKPPDYRNWEYAKTTPPPNAERFIVLSYNILADYLAIDHRSKLYFHIPRYMLDWEWRKRSILFELGLWSADIMCLQEVDKFQDLEEELKLRGYGGIWKMRTGNAIDGCAVFWRTSRFKLLYEESIEFSKLGLRDNVAQICVLELMSQNSIANAAALCTSSTSSNKVVICNIHVLYNPRRGEIKLGQVRLLLDRARAVSRIWNDAPVVLCGDLNCTPKSPLYKFISEQKLNLSGVDRDKVSGQASAEICAPRPYNSSYGPNPSPIAQPSSNSIQHPVTDHKLDDCVSEILKQKDPDGRTEGIVFNNDNSQPQCVRTVLDASDLSCTILESGSVGNGICAEEAEAWQQNVVGWRHDYTDSPTVILTDGCKENPAVFPAKSESSADQLNAGIDKSPPQVISHPNKSSPNGNDREPDGELNSGSISVVSLCEDSQSNADAESSNTSLGILALSLEDSASGGSKCLSTQSIVNDENSGILAPNQATILRESTSICDSEDKKLENVFPDLEEGISGEDESAFFSALNGPSTYPSDFALNLRSGLDCSPKEFSCDPNDPQFCSPKYEVLNNFASGLNTETGNAEETPYNPASWTPMEIATATGSADCTNLEHPLKLKSTYVEVQDCSGTRDTNGEPLVTSYNRCFMGTVDYIWCSEGLQTVRVLAPLPKHAMQWTPGFPTKKWGSDHIALASELALTSAGTDSNSKVQ